MSLYLGENLISGVNTPVQGRVLGQIIHSLIPLNDAGLHLADGSVLSGTGSYSDFYDYMENLYNNTSVITKNTYFLDFYGRWKPTIDANFNVSGFDSTHYLKIPNGRIDDSEYVIKFTTGSSVTTAQIILHSENFIAVEISTGGWLFSWDWTTSASKSILQVSANTTYWLKVQINGTTRTFFTSTDGTNYTQRLSYSDTATSIGDDYECRIGVSSSNDNNPFLGSIDLTETYVKVGGVYYWKPIISSKGSFIEEDDYQYLYQKYNTCGKFVIDTTNKTIRLPYINDIITSTTDSNQIGALLEPSLPNITGKLGNISRRGGVITTGAFYDAGNNGDVDYNNVTGMVAGFNAHLVNGIYGNNASGDKVQPQSVKAYIYIVVATLTKTDIEVDIDEVATDLNMLNHDLNKKVDKDSLIEIPVIVQSYRNGLSWYRIWSDGWCEQGGRFKTDSGSAGYKDVNLLIAMADTNFDVYITRGAESTTTNYNVWAQNPSYTRSTTTIKVYVSNISAYVYWRVCGKC